jgi:peptidoglycan-binding protein CsiV
VKKILALFGCLAGVVAAVSAAPATNAYVVEVLVFENRLPELEGSELWTRNSPAAAAPDVSGAIVLSESAPANSSLAAALQRDGTYRVLAHHRWRQTAEEKSATKAIRLRNPSGQLDGTVRFYMSRFLHVDVDLALQEQTGVAGGVTYRLTEHRRVKTQEANYFDHPKLGVLVRVSAVGKETE